MSIAFWREEWRKTFFKNYLLQVVSSVLLLIFTLQKETSAAFEGSQSLLYTLLMFTSFRVSHCLVTSVFKCVAVNSLGIPHKVRHAAINWHEQHISHNSKEERLTYMQNFFFIIFSCLLLVPTEEIIVLLWLTTPLPSLLCSPRCFSSTWWYVTSHVPLGLKVHLSASRFGYSITPRWLISDTLAINSHQSCCICLGFSENDFVGWKRLYQIHSLQDFILQLNSVIYYPCWARISLFLVSSPQTTGTFISGNNSSSSYIHIFTLLNTFQE